MTACINPGKARSQVTSNHQKIVTQWKLQSLLSQRCASLKPKMRRDKPWWYLVLLLQMIELMIDRVQNCDNKAFQE